MQLQSYECESGIYYASPSAVISPDAHIGADTKIWHNTVVLASARIGRSCVVGSGVNIEGVVGDRCKIQSGVLLYNGVTLEDDVFVGPGVTFTNDLNPRAFDPNWQITETYVRTGASIGARSTIVCGNTLGELSLVGAGSVVTRNVSPLELVAGVPAQHRGWVDLSGRVVSRDLEMPAELGYLLVNTQAAIAKLRNGEI
jgi:acetyltransferase-like isoleucine patch superfamily enzyme